MAISRMQEPQQIQSGIGSLQDPRQGYFLGKLVKKAGRAVKKITKSPLGKLALLGGGAYLTGGLMGGGGGLGNFSKLFGAMKGGLGTGGKFSTLGDLFRVGGEAGAKFSIPRMLAGGLGATALAAPFFMGGDEEEEVVEQMDPRYQVQRAKDYYTGQGTKGAGLDFMPQKKYVMKNFYAADGGRAGYANGMMVEDEEEEFIRTGAGVSRRMPKTFLNMGGDAGQQQAEQMLMMEYVKYKNKGGNMSFEQFVKAVMQQQQAPEGAGMEQPQPVMMAANGGPVPGSEVAGYTTPAGYNKFDYRSGAGVSRRMPKTFLNMGGDAGQAQAEQMLMMEYVKYKNKGGTLSFEQFVKAVMQEAAPEGAGMEQPVAMAADGGLMTQVPGYTTPEGYNKFDYPSGGKEVRVGKQEGGIMETEVSEEIMPLLDMDGKEKDYRNTGGFVELGRKEKADDVPARLSKNEFVFTADAVRNAGGGDIDKGAEVMENLMNNLEQGGEISEESQGLEGAQAMYEQQQMLQSRIV